MVFENTAFRTSLDNPAHKRSVEETFPPSTIAALPVVAEEGNRVLVDMTDVAYRDWNDVAGTLTRLNQGSYSVARNQSSIDRVHTRDRMRRTARSTSHSRSRRPAVRAASSGRIVPDGRAFTLRQHISILPLPDAGFRPRELDPRVGFFGITFKDYGQPIQRAGAAVDLAPSPRARRSERPALADQESDSLLHRPGHSGADAAGHARRRALLERSVRSRRPLTGDSSPSFCRRAKTRSTRATTSCSGRIATSAAGPWAARSAIRAPARSSRAWRASIRIALARTTTSTRR